MVICLIWWRTRKKLRLRGYAGYTPIYKSEKEENRFLCFWLYRGWRNPRNLRNRCGSGGLSERGTARARAGFSRTSTRVRTREGGTDYGSDT